MQITKTNSIQALPILFIIFFFLMIFLSYIDEGHYSFDHLVTPIGLFEFSILTCVFTLIGFMLFSIFNKIGNLPFLAKILIATVLAIPATGAIWSTLYLTYAAF